MLVLIGGLLGGFTGFGMCYYANVISFPLNHRRQAAQQLAVVDPDHVRADDSRRRAHGCFRHAGHERPADAAIIRCSTWRGSRSLPPTGFFLCIKARDKKFDLAKTKAFLESLNPHGVFEIED